MNDKERVEKVLYSKKIKIGKTKPTSYDPKPYNVYLHAQIKEKFDAQKRSTDLKKIKRYKTLSLVGYSKYFSGQIYDRLTPENIDFSIDPKKIQEIKRIWKRWHLHDLKAGTIKQEKALSPKLRWASNYDKAIKKLKEKGLHPDRGYKYGSDWLVEPLPEKIEKKLRRLLK